MFSIYNRSQIVFNNGNGAIDFQFGAEISDYEDTFVIETQIAIDDIVRGWLGDVRIVFSGHSLDNDCNWNKEAMDVVLYKDALCYRRTVEYNSTEPAVYKYMFMKY